MVEQVKQFLEGSEVVEFRGLTAQEKYYWIEEVLIRFKYHRLKRGEKGACHEESKRFQCRIQETGGRGTT